MKKIISLLLLLLFVHGLFAQESIHFDLSRYPQWTRDLRRGSIVAFGSFPFTYFFTSFGYDIFRMSTNNWDSRYAPWPFTSAGAIERSNSEKLMVVGIAAGASILISFADFLIERNRRARIREQAEMYPEAAPIIITRPLDEE